MLDREVVKEFLEEEFQEREIKIPEGIRKSELIETFCLFVENDYYEWLKDNYRSFFHSLAQNGTDWNWIKERISKVKNEQN